MPVHSGLRSNTAIITDTYTTNERLCLTACLRSGPRRSRRRPPSSAACRRCPPSQCPSTPRYTLPACRHTRAHTLTQTCTSLYPNAPNVQPHGAPQVQPQLSPSSAASGGSNSMISRSPRSLAMQADPNALILPAEGFRVENGKKSPLPGLELNMYAPAPSQAPSRHTHTRTQTQTHTAAVAIRSSFVQV